MITTLLTVAGFCPTDSLTSNFKLNYVYYFMEEEEEDNNKRYSFLFILFGILIVGLVGFNVFLLISGQ